jgi:hypothetical protein
MGWCKDTNCRLHRVKHSLNTTDEILGMKDGIEVPKCRLFSDFRSVVSANCKEPWSLVAAWVFSLQPSVGRGGWYLRGTRRRVCSIYGVGYGRV